MKVYILILPTFSPWEIYLYNEFLGLSKSSHLHIHVFGAWVFYLYFIIIIFFPQPFSPRLQVPGGQALSVPFYPPQYLKQWLTGGRKSNIWTEMKYVTGKSVYNYCLIFSWKQNERNKLFILHFSLILVAQHWGTCNALIYQLFTHPINLYTILNTEAKTFKSISKFYITKVVLLIQHSHLKKMEKIMPIPTIS